MVYRTSRLVPLSCIVHQQQFPSSHPVNKHKIGRTVGAMGGRRAWSSFFLSVFSGWGPRNDPTGLCKPSLIVLRPVIRGSFVSPRLSRTARCVSHKATRGVAYRLHPSSRLLFSALFLGSRSIEYIRLSVRGLSRPRVSDRVNSRRGLLLSHELFHRSALFT